MIPESFIQDILARIDIVDLIDSYVPLKKAGANFTACCPFHNEKTPSFSVSPGKQFYHCFGCGAHGTAIGFLMEYQGLGFVEVIHDLAARVGLQVPETRQSGDGNRSLSSTSTAAGLADLMSQAAGYYREQLKLSAKAIAYLKRRGVTGEIAARFGIGYAPEGWQNLAAAFADYHAESLVTAGLVIRNEEGRRYDRFRDRVIFPIVSPRGETIAFGGRILDQGEPKYLNSPETPLFEKGRELFGLPQARIALRNHNEIVVVEGYMDVVALAQHGIEHCVATLGTATTAGHVQKLLRQVDRIIFCFDGDAAGRKAAWRALENALTSVPDHKQILFVFLPTGDDPDSLVRREGREAFLERISHAVPLSDHLVRELSGRHPPASAEGRAALVAAAKPLLQQLHAPLLRLQLVKRLAEVSRFSQTEIERLCELRRLGQAAPARASSHAPSLLRRLLALILDQPARILRISPECLPDTPGEGELLHRIRSIVSNDPAIRSNALIFMLNTESLIQELVGELINPVSAQSPSGLDEDNDEMELEFQGVVVALEQQAQRRTFFDLVEKVKICGVAGLSADEKLEYSRLLSLVGRLS